MAGTRGRVGTLVAALVLPLAAVAAPASAERSPKCNGHTATNRCVAAEYAEECEEVR